MIEHITANWELYIAAVGAFIGFAYAVAKITPNQTDDKIVERVKDAFDSFTKKK